MRHLLPILSWLLVLPAVAQPATQSKPVPAAPTISLFNGRDFAGLQIFASPATVKPEDAWKVADGLLHCTGVGKGYVRTVSSYADYTLHAEWRWPSGAGNSGIMLNMVGDDQLWPKGFEAQLASGRAGDFASYSDARSHEEIVSHNPSGVSTGRLSRPGPGVEKPVGEWNSFDIVVAGDTIRLIVNGTEVNHMTGVLPSAGTIGFQSEGKAVDFRNLTLTPLPPAKDLNAPMPARGGGAAAAKAKSATP